MPTQSPAAVKLFLRPRRFEMRMVGPLLLSLFILGCHERSRPPAVLPTEESKPATTTEALPDSPFLNVRPDVPYVGDAVCAKCHREIANAYARHPMGQSLLPVSGLISADLPEAKAGTPRVVNGTRLRVERRGQKLIHLGEVGGQAIERAVQFALGSGRQGRSYLVNDGGFLFQSPISWYSRKQDWDLAPGYDEKQLLFFRQISDQCLFCHCNGAAPPEGATNHFPEPVFPQGYAIGCERCHGPGGAQVKDPGNRDAATGADYTIVNPKHLGPGLRDSVCEQCHLQGEAHIVRRGHSIYDYRPGLPLDRVISVFVRPVEKEADQRSVSELQQFYLSHCYIRSAGSMSCTSCHDAHSVPDPESRDAFYRARCLKCHQNQPCSEPIAVRRAKSPGDSCIACHMPRLPSADISHAALSDHRIPRRPREVSPKEPTAQPGAMSLVHFHRGRTDSRDRELDRDLALAMISIARKMAPPEARRALAQSALPLLENAVARVEDDMDAQEALGFGLGVTGFPELGLAALDKVLSRLPNRETALANAAESAENLGRTEVALDRWQRLVRVNPWQPSYLYRLARNQAAGKAWAEAIATCRTAIRLDPTYVTARRLLVSCLVQFGDKERALSELGVIQAIAMPNEREGLQRWFDSLQK